MDIYQFHSRFQMFLYMYDELMVLVFVRFEPFFNIFDLH